MDVGNDETLRTAQAERGERIAEVCPRIPGRFTYTCSGRCTGCRKFRKNADQDTTKYAPVY